MATARLGNAFMHSNPVNARSRVSWIAALSQSTLFAPMTFSGSCNRDLFEVWLEQCLLPQVQPGTVIVIDHASFHRSQTLMSWWQKQGVRFCIYPLTHLT